MISEKGNDKVANPIFKPIIDNKDLEEVSNALMKLAEESEKS